MASVPAPRTRSLPLPRVWGVRPSDITALLVGNALLIVAMWARHGGLDQLHTLGGTLDRDRPAHRPARDVPARSSSSCS